MNTPVPKPMTVVSNHVLTDNMNRIVLRGEDVADFPENVESGYIKLLFNEQGGTDISSVPEGERPIMRTYSIRSINRESNEITVDFALHQTSDPKSGYGSRWATSAKAGDAVSIFGPGRLLPIPEDKSWYLFAVDMTSLPAASAKLELLPRDAAGEAFIEVTSEADIQDIDAPKGIKLNWFVRSADSSLAEKVTQVEWRNDDVYAWCACEFNDMRAIRRFLRNEKELAKDDLYISSYWKEGVTEEGHKVAKMADLKEND